MQQTDPQQSSQVKKKNLNKNNISQKKKNWFSLRALTPKPDRYSSHMCKTVF